MKNLKQHLIGLGACQDAVYWCGERTLDEAWRECPRADWMLWLCERHMGEAGWMTKNDLRLEASFAAEYALQFVPEGEDRPRLAIEAARGYVAGTMTFGELQAAGDAARDAAGAAAWAAARDAARDAAWAATQKLLADSIRVRWPKIGGTDDTH